MYIFCKHLIWIAAREQLFTFSHRRTYSLQTCFGEKRFFE